MRVECPACKAHYKLDDSKVSSKGLRVKCSKCGHVFRIAAPHHDEMDDIPAFSPDDEPTQMSDSRPEMAKTKPAGFTKQTPKEGLRGNLETIGLPDIIQMLHLGRKTGALHIKRGEERKTIYFVEGEIVSATTNITHEMMAAYLLKHKHITKETMASIAEEAVTTGRPEEAIIKEAVPVSPEEHQARVTEYVSDLIYGTFHWNSGSVLFIENELPPEECQRVSNTTENLVMEGVRRIDEWSRIRQAIPSHRVILQQNPEPQTQRDQILLNSDEWKIMALVDSKRTVSEICAEARESEFDVSKVLYGLLSIGLLEKKGIKEEEKEEEEFEQPEEKSDEKPKEKKRPETEFRKTLIFTPAKLIMKVPEEKMFPLGLTQVTVGRSSKDSDIAIPDDGHASRVHAQVSFEDHNYILTDMGSTNGTFVNGEKIDSVVLKHGDEIQIGQSHFVFHEK